MIVVNVKQCSPEWHKLRCGIPTSSKFDKIITSTGARSGQLEDAAIRLACEILTGEPSAFFQTKWMKRGNMLEPQARLYYEMISNPSVTVDEVGLIYKDEARLYSTSTDGLISDKKGLLEIKCPSPDTQAEYLLLNEFPKKYMPQVQGELFVSGLEYCDFLSFCPGMKHFICRVFPDLEYHKKLEYLLMKTIELRDSYVEKLGR